MKPEKILLILGLLLMLGYLWGLRLDNKELGTPNEQYLQELENYKKQVEKFRELSQKQFVKENTSTTAFGTENIRSNNFEGPEASIHALEFWNKPVFKNSRGVMDYSFTFMAFDPDHPSLGMPDVETTLSPITLYDPRKKTLGERISNFLGSNPADPPRPYKVFSKEIIPNPADSTAKRSRIEMQLWLTQFTLTITAKPDRIRKNKVNLTKEEKEKKIYPGFWYQQSGQLSANDLKGEFRNNRYGNLKIWLRLRPNNAPWYVNNAIGQNEKPNMAIGAVYCLELVKEPKEIKLNEIHTSVGIGKELALYREPQFGEGSPGAFPIGSSTLDYDAYLGSSIIENDTTKSGIWNRDFFVKIYMKNFGSWKDGFLGSRKYDDQLNYTFIMPVLVEGSWDVHAPYEIIPDWEPDKPYFKKGISLVPQWGLGRIGTFLSYGLFIVLGLMLFVLLFPQFLTRLIKSLGSKK